MKLLTVNMEGMRHIEKITELILSEEPDCICLQEAPKPFTDNLTKLGYLSVFALMCTDTQNDVAFDSGIIFASRLPFLHHINYYAETGSNEKPVLVGDRIIAMRYPYVFAQIKIPDEGIFSIATTHVMVTKDGYADDTQTAGLTHLLQLLQNEPSHILCGDFNMPRGYNHLYKEVTKTYKDMIPQEYASSLDRTLHKSGARTDLNAPIFEIYMVDYIFSQPSYYVKNVKLKFGVSDHAAVIADIKLVPTKVHINSSAR